MATDRRIERTQASLRHAMVQLIIEQGFEATTVSQITERANVGRSTFYAHFADKEDLLQGSLEHVRGFLEEATAAVESQRERDVHPALAFCLPMLEHAVQMRALFVAMVGRRGGDILQDLVHDIWADIVRANWDQSDELAVQAIAGAFGATLHWWLIKAPELEPVEVDRRFRAVLGGVFG
jgi:AcrR family transcriptional regulator